MQKHQQIRCRGGIYSVPLNKSVTQKHQQVGVGAEFIPFLMQKENF